MDLDDSQAAAAVPETPADDGDLEFDLSDFEETPRHESDALQAEQVSTDMELEFEVEEEAKAEETTEMRVWKRNGCSRRVRAKRNQSCSA